MLQRLRVGHQVPSASASRLAKENALDRKPVARVQGPKVQIGAELVKSVSDAAVRWIDSEQVPARFDHLHRVLNPGLEVEHVLQGAPVKDCRERGLQRRIDRKIEVVDDGGTFERRRIDGRDFSRPKPPEYWLSVTLRPLDEPLGFGHR